MTKRIKTILFAALGFCFALFMFLGISFSPSQKAAAYVIWGDDKYFDYDYSGSGIVSFVYGADVEGDTLNTLTYTMNIKGEYINTHHAGFASKDTISGTVMYPDYKNLNWDYGRVLNVYRQDANGTVTPIAGYLIGDFNRLRVVYKKSLATNGAIDESDTVKLDIATFFNEPEDADLIDEASATKLWNGESVDTIADRTNVKLEYCKEMDYSYNMELRDYKIKLTVPSNYSKYYVKFCYAIAAHEEFLGYYGHYTIKSSAHSIYDRVERINAAGNLESTFNETQLIHANAILSNKEVGDVTVKYLKQIGNTPYATKVEKTIKNVTYNGETGITNYELLSLLSKEERHALQSVICDFKRHEGTNTYTAVYNESVWLASETVDGNKANYFLDLNKSFAEYYGGLVGDGIFTEELYNYIFYQKIYTVYPAIDELLLTPDNLHGYFGYVVIPKTNTINQVWYELFDGQPNFEGVINGFNYEEKLSFTAYQSLLSDYHYNWLEKIWNSLSWDPTTGYDASHYIIFADTTTDEGLVSEGNDNGHGSQLEGGIKEFFSSIGSWLTGTWESINGFAISTTGKISGIIFLIGIGAIIFVIIKLRSKGGKGKKKRRK